MLRSLAEKFSRGVVLKRRLPTEFSSRPIFVSPDSALRFWRHNLHKVDATLLRLVRELVRPGAVIWDIGANVGMFAFAASVLAGNSGAVVAVEPDPWLASLLLRSGQIIYPDSAPVAILLAAITDSVSVVELNIACRGRSANFITGFGSTQSGGARQRLNVPSLTLDHLLQWFPRPTILKVDAEGMEPSIFRAACEVLCGKPTVITEAQPMHFDDVCGLLKDRGYRLFTTELKPLSSLDDTENIVAIA